MCRDVNNCWHYRNCDLDDDDDDDFPLTARHDSKCCIPYIHMPVEINTYFVDVPQHYVLAYMIAAINLTPTPHTHSLAFISNFIRRVTINGSVLNMSEAC